MPYRDDLDRGGAARGSRQPILPFKPGWGGYQAVDLIAQLGPAGRPYATRHCIRRAESCRALARARPYHDTVVISCGELSDVMAGQHFEACYLGRRDTDREVRPTMQWDLSHNEKLCCYGPDPTSAVPERYLDNLQRATPDRRCCRASPRAFLRAPNGAPVPELYKASPSRTRKPVRKALPYGRRVP